MMNKTPEVACSRPLPEQVSQPALRALDAAGITTLGQLAALSEKELLKLHGVGPKGIRILRQALQEAGLDFAGTKSGVSRRERGETGG